ncbi:MAG: hypothetical protein K2P78_03855, partial [Gemmataceae bacterium]|nr:hypothetical protein [Gemmataceae bacterium]
YESYVEQLIDRPSRTESRIIPAVYRLEERQELVTPARTEWVTVPATWRTVASFYAAAPDALGGVRLATRGGRLLVANGTGGSVSLTEYTDFDHPPLSLPPTDPARAFGVFVG